VNEKDYRINLFYLKGKGYCMLIVPVSIDYVEGVRRVKTLAYSGYKKI